MRNTENRSIPSASCLYGRDSHCNELIGLMDKFGKLLLADNTGLSKSSIQ